jgi:hypothetical protein
MKKKPNKNKVLYIFYIFLTFIFIGSAVVFTTSNNLQPAFSQGYIPPPPLTTSTNQNDQIANNNNNNPSTSNTIGSSSSGQSQLNQGQQQQPNSNCNTKFMVGCGSTNPTTTSTQQQLPNSNCNTKFMVGCGSTNPTTAGPGSTMQNERMCDPGPCNPPSPTFNITINNTTLPTVDISKDPTQKITSIVTNGFGQGAPNLLVVLQVKDPAGKIVGTFSGKTDNDGKNVISVPVKTPGTWSADVEISNIAASPRPFFTTTYTWNAVSGFTSSNLEALVNLPRTTVILSNDPRQQILTTVKDPAGKGVKDIALTIKITNPDSVSKTFSRITDANGVDQFVIPVDKVGNWVATLTMIDPNGKTVPITDVAWKAIP